MAEKPAMFVLVVLVCLTYSLLLDKTLYVSLSYGSQRNSKVVRLVLPHVTLS